MMYMLASQIKEQARQEAATARAASQHAAEAAFEEAAREAEEAEAEALLQVCSWQLKSQEDCKHSTPKVQGATSNIRQLHVQCSNNVRGICL